MRYSDVLDRMQHAKSGAHMSRRKVGNNTYLEDRADGSIALRLHATDVVTWWADGRVRLDSEGWLTVTTKARMNEWARPFGVSSTRGVWRIDTAREDWETERAAYSAAQDAADAAGINPYTEEWQRAHPYPSYWHGIDAPYIDGAVLDMSDPVGSLVKLAGGPDAVAARDLVKRDAETKRAVDKYLRGMSEDVWRRVLEDANERGTTGDCLFCQLNWAREQVTDVDHLLAHIEESYYMVTLAYAAVRESGYRVPEVILPHLGVVKRALRRYLLARLLLGPSGGRRGNAAPSWQDAGNR